ncbi:OPT/YSL family transporter, partial [Vibrio parahaemolyticus]
VVGLIVGFFGKAEFKWIEDFHLKIPELLKFKFDYRGIDMSKMPNFGFEPSVLLIGAGMIVGLRVSTSMLVGALILYFIVGPEMIGIHEVVA